MHVLWVVLFAGFIGVFGDEVYDGESCGLSFYNETIRRPTLARLREFPWLARLGYQKSPEVPPEFHFHATLIHQYYAVTTVFAADYLEKSLKFVRLGDYHTSDETDCQEFDGEEICAPPPQDIPVLYVVKHPDHDRPRMSHDLVLVKFQQPADLTTSYVQPICLPPPNMALSEDALLFLSAWCGSVKTGISVVPRQYRMQPVSSALCKEKLSPHIAITLHESELCAALDLAKDAPLGPKEVSLRGSTGAPLQMLDRTGTRFQLVGMTSVGVKNAARDVPYVFTDVLRLGDWLHSTVDREEQKRAGRL
uniref:Putative clip-domain serine protease n=1 Tax=Culex tarsalis TaxID=7177 RepID=A0A1Q3FPS6_CULTA